MVQELFAIADPITVNKVVEVGALLAMYNSHQIEQGDACVIRKLKYSVPVEQEGLVHVHVFIYQSLFSGELIFIGVRRRGSCILPPGDE